MKRKWIILPAILALVVLGVLVVWPPSQSKGTVTITFRALTNDATGARMALFSATNGTGRLFVRGRSEIEVQGTLSNQVTVTQITSVNYLKPGQSVSFLVPCPSEGAPWRLKFHYIDQFGRLENIKYELGWALYKKGVRVPVNRLPRHEIRELTTEWTSE